MSGPVPLAKDAESVHGWQEQQSSVESASAVCSLPTSAQDRVLAAQRSLGNQRFSSLLKGAPSTEFNFAFAETTAPPQPLQTIGGQAALGARAEIQLLWEPYAGEAFWPLGAGETTRSWLPSIARESWFNRQQGSGPTSGNDLLVCKLEPGGAQVFKVILNEQKAVAQREFLKTTAISSSLPSNVRHNIELLQQRVQAPGIDAEQREVLRRTIEVLRKADAALADPSGKTPLPPEIQFELTSLGGAGEQFGIGSKSSHLRILGKTFGSQGKGGRLLQDIVDHTAVRDRALAARLRSAGVLDPLATDPDIVPMRLLLTPQARAWLALSSGLTPDQWLKQATEQARAAAGKAAYDEKKAKELEQLRKQPSGKGKGKTLNPEQLEKQRESQADKAAKKAQRAAEKQFDAKAFRRRVFDSSGSVVDSLAPPAVSPLPDVNELVRRAGLARAARAVAEATAAQPGASRSVETHRLLLLARNDDVAARLALADAAAARSGSRADAEAARQLRSEFTEGARVLNEMGEVSRRLLEGQQVAEAPRASAPTVIVSETRSTAVRPASIAVAPTSGGRTAAPAAAETAGLGQAGIPGPAIEPGGAPPATEQAPYADKAPAAASNPQLPARSVRRTPGERIIIPKPTSGARLWGKAPRQLTFARSVGGAMGETGWAGLGEMLGNGMERLNELGIRNLTAEEIAKLKPQIKAYQEAHPKDGVLIAVQIETWDPLWRPSDARPTRSFVSVIPQFGGMTQNDAIDRWSREPKFLRGANQGSRIDTDFIWISPGEYVPLTKTNFINGRYRSDTDQRMLIFQFVEGAPAQPDAGPPFSFSAVNTRTGISLRVQVVKPWTANLSDTSIRMTARVYDPMTKNTIESELKVIDTETIQENWITESGTGGINLWRKVPF